MTTSAALWVYQLVLFIFDLTVFILKANWLLIKSLYGVVIPVPDKEVEGDIVLITGGGHGLGRALALMFAEKKAKVVLWDINLENCQKTADEIWKLGYKAYPFQCDVSSRIDVSKVAQQVRKQVGHPTILINNAGILHCQPFLNLSDQQLERIVEVNLTSHFWMIREFLPAMQQSKKGHIVCISSMAGIAGFPNLVDYGATKFGVAGLMKHLRAELRSQNFGFINCTTIHPTIIDTGMAKKPFYRHRMVHPIVGTEYAADVIMDAVLKNKVVCYIPSINQAFYRIINALPITVQDAFSDFTGVGLNAHD